MHQPTLIKATKADRATSAAGWVTAETVAPSDPAARARLTLNILIAQVAADWLELTCIRHARTEAPTLGTVRATRDAIAMAEARARIARHRARDA